MSRELATAIVSVFLASLATADYIEIVSVEQRLRTSAVCDDAISASSSDLEGRFSETLRLDCVHAPPPFFIGGSGYSIASIDSIITTEGIAASGLATAYHVGFSSHSSSVDVEVDFLVIDPTPFHFFGTFFSQEMHAGLPRGIGGSIELRNDQGTLYSVTTDIDKRNPLRFPELEIVSFDIHDVLAPGAYTLILDSPASTEGREVRTEIDSEFAFQFVVPEPTRLNVVVAFAVLLSAFSKRPEFSNAR